MPALFDLDARFRAMDTAGEGYMQILTTANPPVETFAGPADALDLSRIANDEMAELVAAVSGAILRRCRVPADERRGCRDRRARPCGRTARPARRPDLHGHPGHSARRSPFPSRSSTKVAELDIPILLHPVRGADRPTTRPKTASRFDTWRVDRLAVRHRVRDGAADLLRASSIGTPTSRSSRITWAVSRRTPPNGSARATTSCSRPHAPGTSRSALQQHPFDYFKQFYADTITIGSVPALRCGIDFFGVDRVMFATDMPFDTQGGLKYIEVALKAMEAHRPVPGRQGEDLRAQRLSRLLPPARRDVTESHSARSLRTFVESALRTAVDSLAPRLINCQTRSGDSGRCRTFTPSGVSASSTALAIAAGDGIAAPSPAAFCPSVVNGSGTG